jgi:hypothetical protein
MDSHYEELMVIMKAGQEAKEARIETGREPREVESKTGLEAVKAMDWEANPEEMEALVEHQGVPKEEVMVETIRPLEEQYGDWYLTVGCRGQPKKWTQGDGRSWKKLATARKWIPAMPFLHNVRDGVIKDRLLRRDNRMARNATLKYGIDAQDGAASRKRESIQHDRRADSRVGCHEVNSRDFHRVMESGWTLWRGWPPLKRKKRHQKHSPQKR